LNEVAAGFVAVGRVLGTRGARGELKIESLAPDTVLAVGRRVTVAGTDYDIEHSRRSGRLLDVKLTDVDTRQAALALRGAYLQVREDDLPILTEGEFYRFQLIGLSVRGIDGRDLGRVTDVLSAPENDVYIVQGTFGEVLIPAIDDVVRNVDIVDGVITIEIVPGMLP